MGDSPPRLEFVACPSCGYQIESASLPARCSECGMSVRHRDTRFGLEVKRRGKRCLIAQLMTPIIAFVVLLIPGAGRVGLVFVVPALWSAGWLWPVLSYRIGGSTDADWAVAILPSLILGLVLGGVSVVIAFVAAFFLVGIAI